MTKDQVRQQIKNQTLNSIRKLYEVDGFKMDGYDPESYREQRDRQVEYLLDDLYGELIKIKNSD